MPAKLVSIVHCIVVEGLSRTAAISVTLSLWQIY